MKFCTKCQKMLPLDNFGKDNYLLDRLTRYCKLCINEYSRNHMKRPDRKAARKKYYQEYCSNIRNYLRYRFYGIKSRCNNPNDTRYKKYGAKGIKCLFDFESFFNYITITLGFDTIKKLKCLHIHRINNGNYGPDSIELLTPGEHRRKHLLLGPITL